MCHADSLVIEYFRATSWADREFLDAQNSKVTSSQVRMLILVPWEMVSARTENWRRQAAHFPTRRGDMEPVRVVRLAGFRK